MVVVVVVVIVECKHATNCLVPHGCGVKAMQEKQEKLKKKKQV